MLASRRGLKVSTLHVSFLIFMGFCIVLVFRSATGGKEDQYVQMGLQVHMFKWGTRLNLERVSKGIAHLFRDWKRYFTFVSEYSCCD